MQQEGSTHPVRFSVDYPDRDLDRFTTFFRVFAAIPILILLGTVAGADWEWTADEGGQATVRTVGTGGALFLGPLLMIVFRQKYPRWWFDWNLELMRFVNRVGVYVALMDDRYPATEDPQSVRLDLPYPDARRDLNRWLPLVKWFLAIPHYLVLFILYCAMFIVLIIVWCAVLFTARYPRGLFEFVEGVLRWHNRVVAYAFLLVTDRYPPFSLAP